MSSKDTVLENALLRLEKLEKQIEKILLMQQKLLEQQQTVLQSNTKLDNHINFIESVYDICRKPFGYLLSYYYGKNGMLPSVGSSKMLT